MSTTEEHIASVTELLSQAIVNLARIGQNVQEANRNNGLTGAFATKTEYDIHGVCLDLKIVEDEVKKYAGTQQSEKPKKYESRKLQPCNCGSKKIDRWIGSSGAYYFKCQKCGLESEHCNTDAGARRAWNKLVKENENEDQLK